ncbi:MAG: glycosyltransferase [Dysgonamonadaceae bacterium]|nr:glycosyltransferase [Dysgonamonadaceae bacterium]
MNVSVIIPTLNAEKEIGDLLQKLHNQTVALEEIIVIDSQSDDETASICREDNKVVFIPIERSEFDHGGTRDRAFRQSQGSFVLFLTQDAVPEDEYYVERLLQPFQDPEVAMVSGRQIAKAQASPIEKLVRNFNYPPESNVRTQNDIPIRGVKAFFASNVCSAYRRSAYLAVGGFDSPILTNEDMLIAARLICSGYKVAYCAEAKVIHSHSLTLKQQFVRNYNTGIFMRKNIDLFRNMPVSTEGIKMVNYVLPRLWKEKHILQSMYFCIECAVRLIAYQSGWLMCNK